MKMKMGLLLLSCACVMALAGCNLPEKVQPTPTHTADPNPIPTGLVTVAPPTPTPEMPSPTAVPPTATLGAPLQHYTPGRAIDITTIRMINAKEGWGLGGLNQVGDHVFTTQDGGTTWKDVTPPEPNLGDGRALDALAFFPDPWRGWVLYTPTGGASLPETVRMWRTQDGGVNWQYASINTDYPEFFVPGFLFFADEMNGWLMVHVGAGMMHDYVYLYSTQDGGVTWQKLLDPYNDGGIMSFPKTGMVFADGQNGWLTRDGQGVDPLPHVFRTADGGMTWGRIDLPAPGNAAGFYDKFACGSYSPVLFPDLGVGLVMNCKDIDTFKIEENYFYSSKDQGASWDIQIMPKDFKISYAEFGVVFFNRSQGLALSRKIYRTENEGVNWSQAKVVTWDGQFSFVDMNTGWAVARNLETGEMALVMTVNGGGMWVQLHPVVGG